MKQIWQADDGKTFDTEKACKDYEKELNLKKIKLYGVIAGKNYYSEQEFLAADGFPIYAATGYTENKQFLINKSRYILKQGKRQTGKSNPDGIYDVTFINDFYYVKDYGTLDQFNGILSITP